MNTERLTTCIKHLAVSGLSSVSTRIKSSCNLIGNRFVMPNVSYTQPLWPSVKKTKETKSNPFEHENKNYILLIINYCRFDKFTFAEL